MLHRIDSPLVRHFLWKYVVEKELPEQLCSRVIEHLNKMMKVHGLKTKFYYYHVISHSNESNKIIDVYFEQEETITDAQLAELLSIIITQFNSPRNSER